jgi:hypothetical protein
VNFTALSKAGWNPSGAAANNVAWRSASDSLESPLEESDIARSFSPEPLEPRRAEFRVSNRVLDIPVTEPQLQRPRIVPIVRQLEPAGVPEHVWMDGEG